MLCIGDAVIAIHDWGIIVAWPDGTLVRGAPKDTDEYRQTAEDLGYGDDTLSLCREHELLHVALCHWLGIPSPVMDMLRHGEMAGAEQRRLEECAVLAVQKFARAMSVDILEAIFSIERTRL